MSIFDQPRPTMNPALFDSNKQLRPEVRRHILFLLNSIFPLQNVYRLTLLGSNVTHQYNESSDIDINVMGTKGQDFDDWHSVFKNFNARPNLLPGTQHPINFFFQEYVAPDRLGNWDNSLGAYDIFNNVWLKRPKPYEQIGDPTDTYAREFNYVKLMMTMIESEINAIRHAVETGDQDKAERSLRSLQLYFKRLDADRKDSYRYGGGSPSIQEDNLIYKLVEHGPYGKLLKDLIGD